MISSSEDMIGCGGKDMTLKLISNASMETFPGNKLSSFPNTPANTHDTLWRLAGGFAGNFVAGIGLQCN